MTEDEAVRLARQMVVMLLWVKILVVIAIVAIITDVVALRMFITFRRTASIRLKQQNEMLEEMAVAIEIMKRHGQVAREQKEESQAALQQIKEVTQKGITQAAATAERVATSAACAAEVVAAKAAEKVAEATNARFEELKNSLPGSAQLETPRA